MSTVLIGGGSGLIGSRLSQLLAEQGFTVWHLSRTPDSKKAYPTYFWDIEKQQIDQQAVDGADYIINLAGAGIADWLWTEKRKKIIIDSRVNTTVLLKNAVDRSANPPRAFISASGIGFYGDRKDEPMTEESPPGTGYLSESCIVWERAVQQLADLGVRTAVLRTGIVLSTRSGALPKMALPLRFFLAVYFGSGRQWMSWIHIDDICRMYVHLMTKDLAGIFNGVAPNPEKNRNFIAAVADAKRKATFMVPAPAWGLKLVLGEMSHTVLDSTLVSSDKIEGTGFSFRFPRLPEALADIFTRKV